MAQVYEKMMTLQDGHQAEIMFFETDQQLKGTIQLLHGMAEHMGRYEEIGYFFMNQGFNVIMHNHRGHGKLVSESEQGHFESIDQLVSDAREIFMTFKEDDVPSVLIGHSMGSIIARKYTIDYPEVFDALILSGTGYYDYKYSAATLLLNTLLMKYPGTERSHWVNQMTVDTFNRKFRPIRTNSDWLSLDEDNVDRFLEDEHCGFLMSLGALKEINDTLKIVQDRKMMSKMNANLNILLLSGEDDPFGGFGKGIHKLGKLYKKAGINHVTVQLYKNARHEVFFEKNKKEVMDNVMRWLDRRLYE